MAFRALFGLGNPGREYAETRHNAGFLVLDRVARRLAGSAATFAVQRKLNAALLRTGTMLLGKPTTYMNLSGQAVGKVCRFHQIAPEEILVVYDDMDLPLGKLRFRAQGSAGGHNGIKSLIQHLGTDEFPRLKVGIGRRTDDREQDEVIGHVLGKFDPDEREAAEEMLERAADAVLLALERGLTEAMGKFNS